jgi:hypothetical protein
MERLLTLSFWLQNNGVIERMHDFMLYRTMNPSFVIAEELVRLHLLDLAMMNAEVGYY